MSYAFGAQGDARRIPEFVMKDRERAFGRRWTGSTARHPDMATIGSAIVVRWMRGTSGGGGIVDFQMSKVERPDCAL